MVSDTMRRRPFDQHAETEQSPQPGDAFSPTAARQPRELVYDALRCRIGEVMPDPIPAALRGDQPPRRIHLRPVGGGTEWTADPADVSPLRADLAAEIRAAQP